MKLRSDPWAMARANGWVSFPAEAGGSPLTNALDSFGVTIKPQAASRKPQAASRKPQAASRKPQSPFLRRRLAPRPDGSSPLFPTGASCRARSRHSLFLSAVIGLALLPAVSAHAQNSLTLSSTSLSLTEGGSTGSFTVKLSAAPTSNVTVTPSSSDTGAVTVSGALTFTSQNYNTAQTVTVTTVQDADATDETATITLTAACASGTDCGYHPGTVTIHSLSGYTSRGTVSGPSALSAGDYGNASNGNFYIRLKSADGTGSAFRAALQSNDTITIGNGTITFNGGGVVSYQSDTVYFPPSSVSGTPSGSTITATGTRSVTASVSISVDDDEEDTAPSFGSGTIANQSLTQNSAMTSVTLPAATGGNGTLSYSISPALPAGLSFNTGTRVLSGTPTGTSASTTYTYTVTDADSNTASSDKDTITFTIAIAEEDTAPSFGSGTIANQSLTQNSAITSVTLPAATGGNGTLSYSISPTLPAGLTFTASTRVLSGTPTGTSASATYTYTVSDADSNTASTDKDTITFTIVVAEEDTAPSFGSGTIANQSLVQNSAMTSLTLPAATGGNGTLSYSISPTLPTGLTFTASTRVLSGTPTGTSASATYTYTVSDGDGNTASTDKDTLTFTIVVAAEDTAPSFGSGTIANQSLTQNSAMTSLTLPAATGGNGTLSYSISPSLPAGLTFTASTRVLSGTPTGTSASATYTYTVADGDNNTASTDEDTITFTIAVTAAVVDSAPSFGSGTIANQSLTQNSAMTSVTLPQATGGNGTLSYSISPSLPAGLTFTASTRVLSGTPTGTSASTTYTYTVSDADNNTASTDGDSLTFTIAVAAAVVDSAPAFADGATITSLSLSQNSAMSSVTLPAATGGNGTLSYSISPALPAGLTFTASTRVLSGTPTGTSASATYTYTVTDADNNTANSDTDTLTFTIAVAADGADTAPGFAGDASIADLSLNRNIMMTSVTLPQAFGGNGTLSYTITPALPAGLTFNAGTRVLSGTPAGTSALTTYTYTVTDADSNTAATDTDTRTFTIAVAAAAAAEADTSVWLSRFGRTVAGQVLDGVHARLEAARTPGSMVSIDGQALTPSAASHATDEDLSRQLARAEAAGLLEHTAHQPSSRHENVRMVRTLTLQEALRGVSFAFTGNADGAGGTLALWGRAAESGFEGREGSLRGDGDVTTGMVGVDYGRDAWLAGLVVSYTDADGDYSHASGSGTITSKLTATTLYAVAEVTPLTELWGAAGYGQGDMEWKPKGAKTIKTDIDWTMAAAGMRSVLVGAAESGGPTLALTADATWARTEADKTGHHAKVEADVTRLRLGLEGGWTTTLEGGDSLTKTLEVGMRHDEGDAETGFGVEAGGGIAWSNPSRGITFDLSGRALVAHEDNDFEDWGVSAGVAIDPDPASERGPAFTLRRELGSKAEGGLDALFEPEALERRAGVETAGGWVAEASWGVPTYGGRFTGVPYAGLRTSDTSRDFRIGWRLTPAGSEESDMLLDIAAMRRERENAKPEHSLGVMITFRW